jgi:hypothetical protein
MKIKKGHTHLSYKQEHTVDMETEAIPSAEIHYGRLMATRWWTASTPLKGICSKLRSTKNIRHVRARLLEPIKPDTASQRLLCRLHRREGAKSGSNANRQPCRVHGTLSVCSHG